MTIGAILAFLSVAFGAFGAHVLKERLGAHYLSIFETGVQYQMVHSLGLILIGILALTAFRGSAGLLQWAGLLMIAGIVLFSGSLYALSISRINLLGIITPFGGIAFLISWALVVVAFLKA
ncbi:DUF423 domain-containing protein [Sporolactobacillus shoreae]|uniref:DUF423 domain-containing protein n=2 Tax=Sporolactobacillus shoreae TaxID=1465501 RepID=A0A4Z0GLZ8_9BACL|nr:DUF423 domain-containing protein [Sporolactobacillus shoreae]TGA98031.1 DUF423 domain-containing protein [Sporolactobacillus shoreae]